MEREEREISLTEGLKDKFMFTRDSSFTENTLEYKLQYYACGKIWLFGDVDQFIKHETLKRQNSHAI